MTKIIITRMADVAIVKNVTASFAAEFTKGKETVPFSDVFEHPSRR